MYIFTINDSTTDVNAVVTRALLAMAGIVSLLYRSNQYYYFPLVAALLLIFAAVFVKKLLQLLKGNTLLLLGIAAFILFVATFSIIVALALVAGGLLVKKIALIPTVTINTKGVNIIKTLSNIEHQWSEFNNIILKDNLLTLDFKSNKLLQLSIIGNESAVDEYTFNSFCSKFIGI